MGITITLNWGAISSSTAWIYPRAPPESGIFRVVDGIPCAKGEWISFHSNKKPAGVTLSRDHTIHGVRYSKGEKLSFDRYGHVLRHPGILELLGVTDDRLAFADRWSRAPVR